MAHVVKPLLTLLGAVLSASVMALGPAQPFAAPALRGGTASNAEPPTAPPPVRLGGLRLGAAPAALIDGQWIGLGARVRGARLHDIRPPYAVLQHPDGHVERLALDGHPDGVPTPAQVDKTLLP